MVRFVSAGLIRRCRFLDRSPDSTEGARRRLRITEASFSLAKIRTKLGSLDLSSVHKVTLVNDDEPRALFGETSIYLDIFLINEKRNYFFHQNEVS